MRFPTHKKIREIRGIRVSPGFYQSNIRVKPTGKNANYLHFVNDLINFVV